MNLAPALLAASLLAACSLSAADSPIPEQWRAAPLTITPVDLGAERVGQLVFRGGIALASSDPRFGGLSGLEVLEDGRVIAVSDDGMWFSARLEFDESGVLIGLTEPRLAAMRDVDGAVFDSKEAGDAEDVTQMLDGRFAVAFEQIQEIRIYDLNRDGPFGDAARGPALGGVERLALNAGLEAIAVGADGAFVVGAENSGALWHAPLEAANAPEPVSRYPLEFGYALTSLDRLPNGDFVALERFYAPLIGARARITRVPAASLANPEVSVTQWADLRAPMPVDNFEGIAAVRGPDGAARLYILSDDNFSAQQRTLLYAFDVVEEESPD